MIIELGHYALVLALATSLIISVLPVIGARRGDAAMMAVATTGTTIQEFAVSKMPPWQR